MASSDFLKLRKLAAKGDLQTRGTDEPVAVRIRNKAGKAVTSVTVTTATNLVLIDSDGTTTVTFATDATIGAVAARINATSNWECVVLDCLKTLASASTLVDGAITAGVVDGITYWDAKVDTSAALQIGVALAFSRHTPAFAGVVPKSHRVNVREVRYSVNMGTAAADSAQLWHRDVNGVETKVFGKLSVDTTDTTISFASGIGEITSKDGGMFVFLVKDAATLADAATNYVQLVGELE